MKIDRSKLRKSSSQVPPDCKAVIEQLKNCGEAELLAELNKFDTWNLGKCELFHWIDLLDVLDGVLEEAAARRPPHSWSLACDLPQYAPKRPLLLQALHFTALLIEHSFSRHLYNSVEHLIQLLESSDMQVVLNVLNLIYMFSKRSNFISRLGTDRRSALVIRLTHLAESWGGRENGFGLADCCKDVPITNLSPSATTLHFEYYEGEEEEQGQDEGAAKTGAAAAATAAPQLHVIHQPHVDQRRDLTAGQLMEHLLEQHRIPRSKQVMVFTYLRLAKLFAEHWSRLCCVQARLQALSILVYSNAFQDNVHSLLYPGLLEELVELLEMPEHSLVEIKAAALRTLTSIIHLERNPNLPKLNTIIEITGANTFHGFLPQMVRTCIGNLTAGIQHPLSSSVLTTALFSFLYHLASYESGGDALVHCGMMESLLMVVTWAGRVPDHVTFVTRAVRVIDLITNLDMTAFQAHNGLQKFVDRLQAEVDVCRREQPYQIQAARASAAAEAPAEAAASPAVVSMEVEAAAQPGPSTPPADGAGSELTCLPQRSALLKSQLNFLKKAIQDPSFSDSIRHLMEGSLPDTLKHIISNAEYYGASLFLLAIDVVTVYAFQEPSLLSSLQDNGLTDVVLHALIVKEVPATREVLSSLPNVFSALCLNARGLEAFVASRPFERLFRVLLSPDYLPAMRRRRGSEPMSDTATKLGNAMDELMRHQPSLRVAATGSIIGVLERLCEMGRDPQYMCSRAAAAGKPEAGPLGAAGAGVRSLSQEGGSSDEEEEDDELGGEEAAPRPADDKEETPAGAGSPSGAASSAANAEKQHVPLIDYVHNVMKFVDAILSNNSTDDHCREFVSQRGLVPLLSILGLPNLPLDFPQTPACQAVASVCKSILNLAHEGQVLREGLLRLSEVLVSLEPLREPPPPPGSSVLLRELAGSARACTPHTAPLLHAMSAAHAYIGTFIHICRTSQADIRQVSMSSWGSELGLAVLRHLSRLYTTIVWESTVLLALCTQNSLPADAAFARHDMERLLEARADEVSMDDAEAPAAATASSSAAPAGGATAAGAAPPPLPASLQYQIKLIKPVLASASKLGRAMTDLFGLLVKLCVGSPLRQRRGQQLNNASQAVSPAARKVARAVSGLLSSAISFSPPDTVPTPKLRLTFYICALSFTSSMLFDEKKQPYHLMLQLFADTGGLDAFFSAFSWALSADGCVPAAADPSEAGSAAAPAPLAEPLEGSGEFLDSWLLLLERLVSPKHLLETPHTLAKASAAAAAADPSAAEPFDPHAFMARVHKCAFQAVMQLWSRAPLDGCGGRLSISVLAILRHILRGELLLRERSATASTAATPAAAATTATAGASAAGASAPPPPAAALATQPAAAAAAAAAEDNSDQLRQLLDMGFPAQACLEALHVSNNSVEQATDYLLSHPPPPTPAAPLADSVAAAAADWSDDSRVARVIAMSLSGERHSSTSSGELMDTSGSEQRSRADADADAGAGQPQDTEPLSAARLDAFTDSALAGCLRLLDALPDTVYRCCDLLVTCVQRNGAQWRDRTLAQLSAQVCEHLEQLVGLLEAPAATAQRLSQLTTSPAAGRAAVRIHLFSLLFEEMQLPCARVVASTPLVPLCVQLLERCQLLLSATAAGAAGQQGSPRWLAPLVLFIDLVEKIAVASQRRAQVAQITGHQWRWFDLGSGKWCSYPAANNATIDAAYWAGETQAHVVSGRRKYTIVFNTMVQVNEETNNRRPVMICLAERPSASTSTSTTSSAATTAAVGTSAAAADTAATDSSAPAAAAAAAPAAMEPLTPAQSWQLLASCVGLLAGGVDADTLQAVLRLCLRLTRTHQLAVRFAELGGVRHLLALRQASSFTGLNTLVTFLVRHTMEDAETLKLTMEKIVRTATLVSNTNYREFHYILRTLGPAACRAPEQFVQVARDTLQVDVTVAPRRGGEDDQRLILKAAAQRAGAAPPLQPAAPCAQAVVEALLHALAAAPEPEPPAGAGAETAAAVEPTSGGDPTTAAAAAPPATTQTQSTEASTAAGKTASAAAAEAAKRRRPLLAKSALCRLLAELVRSYAFVAKVVTEHSYSAGEDSDVTEDCSAMWYILYQLASWPSPSAAADKELAASCRLLVAALAASNHSPDAQTALVAEVRSSLLRMLQLPESQEKHSRIVALTGLIHTMIESCPSSGPQQLQAPTRSGGVGMNNIVKIMVRRGLATDLARIPHWLELGSGQLALTVNAALKPLEVLTRLVNSPTAAPAGGAHQRRGAKAGGAARGWWSASHDHEQTQPTTEPTSNSEATRAQGESMLEDPENTEHDVSVTEATSEAHPADADDDVVLEEIMDQLLERNPDGGGPDTILAEALILDSGGGGGGGSAGGAGAGAAVVGVRMDTDEASGAGGGGGGAHVAGAAAHDGDETRDSGEEADMADDEADVEEEEEPDQEDEEDDEDDEDDEDEDEEGSNYDEEAEDADFEEMMHLIRGETAGRELELDDVWMVAPEPPGASALLFGAEEPATVSAGAGRFVSSAVLAPAAATLADDEQGAADAAGAAPSGAGQVLPVHPMLAVRSSAETVAVQRSRIPRHQRGYRYIHVNTRHNSPAILQRLLGPHAHDVLQLTVNHAGGRAGAGGAPYLLGEPAEFRVIAHRAEDDGLDLTYSLNSLGGVMGGGGGGGGGSAAGLSSIPSALSRWTEESRVLDTVSLYDCVTACKPELLAGLERQRDAELAEWRRRDDERRKQEEAAAADTGAGAGPGPGTADNGGAAASTGSDTAATTAGSSQPTVVSSSATTAAAAAGGSDSAAATASSSGAELRAATPSSLSSVSRYVESILSPAMLAFTSSSSAAAGGRQSPAAVLDTLSRLQSTVGQLQLPHTSSPELIMDTLLSQFGATGIRAPPGLSGVAAAAAAAQAPAATTAHSGGAAPPAAAATASAAGAAAPVGDGGEAAAGAGADTATVTATHTVTTATASDSTVSADDASSTGAAAADGAAAGEQPPAGTAAAGAPAEDFSSILGDMEIPEGVDPSFLAALPDDMRQEVVAEQLRLQRIRQRVRQAQTQQQQPALEVSPEFLEALPPNIQEEVLAQQRMEQHRAAVASALPDEPVDPGDFLQTLPPPLRQTILADLEDSQLGVLPPSMAEEAQTLRREWEARNRQHPYEPIDYSVRSRLNQRYAFHLSPSMLPTMRPSGWRTFVSGAGAGPSGHSSHLMRLRGRQLLDQEAMACLLVLLFLDEPKLNTSRLHRVLRNLSYHCHTRDWIVRALLSMLERCDSTQPAAAAAAAAPPASSPGRPAKRRQVCSSSSGGGSGGSGAAEVVDVVGATPLRQSAPAASAPAGTQPGWLSISMDAALGCRANVFQVQRAGGGVGGAAASPSGGAVKRQERAAAAAAAHMSIHPQAAGIVCRHALDALISLAKCFPSNFLPASAGRPERAERRPAAWRHVDLWELLLRLDAQSGRAAAAAGKGKSVARTQSTGAADDEATAAAAGGGLAGSPFGHLMAMLDHPVIGKSSPLTDSLLRLLSFMSTGVRELTDGSEQLGDLELMRPLIGRAVRVLTSKACSEEGMDDATKLLLHISSGPPLICHMVMDQLLEGARALGHTVRQHIETLHQELDAWEGWMDLTFSQESVSSDEAAGAAGAAAPATAAAPPTRGTIVDRYTREEVVINASKRQKASAGVELRIPSMTALTSKGSSQQFFLRVLKVVIQLRNSVLSRAASKPAGASNAGDPPAAPGEQPAAASSDQPAAVAGEASTSTDVATVAAAAAAQDSPADGSGAPAPADGAAPTQTAAAEEPGAAGPEPGVAGQEPGAVGQEPGAAGQEPELSPSQMDVDPGAAVPAERPPPPPPLPPLSHLLQLCQLWNSLSQCLRALEHTPDQHAVLILQPAVEAFFLVHASSADEHGRRQPQSRQEQLAHIAEQPLSPLPSSTGELNAPAAAPAPTQTPAAGAAQGRARDADADTDDDTRKFLQFAEQHRTVLNQILRQSATHLADGPFSVLVNHTRVLDFDIKRRFFRTELERLDEGLRREDLAVHVRRAHVFEDSYRELHRRSADEWKNRFYIVFEGEEGQDAGGLLREWYIIISREIFNPMYALFCTSPGDRVTYMIHHMSHCNSNHLSYFKFVGRVIAKAIYDNKLLDCYFTRSFYKHILGIHVKYTDMEAEDYEFYKGLVYLIENDISELGYELTFSTDVQEFGVNEVRDLKPRGRHIKVTEENKMEYVRLVCQMKMTGAIQKQLKAFLEGFYDIIPKHLISVFNEQELELLVSGLPTIDLDDLKANTEYHKYQPNSLQIQWFWLALRSFSNEDRAKFIQFVTGTSRVPLQGFAELQGMNGAQKFQIHRDDRSTDRLPSAHTCFNQLDLPAFETYDKLRENLLKAVQECSEGFGFA